MKILVLVPAFVFMSFVQPAFAAEKDPNFTIAQVSLKEVVPTDEEIYLSDQNFAEQLSMPILEGVSGAGGGIASRLNAANVILDQVILIGSKVVNIVKAGAPVVNVRTDAVSVVPMGARGWQDLAGWQAPMSRVYELQFVNGFGVHVVNARLKVSASYGGSYNGHGKYLANVYIVPTALNVYWGFNVNIWLENHDPVNAGTKANPVAALGVDLRYKISTVFPIDEEVGAQDYYITGDGNLLAL